LPVFTVPMVPALEAWGRFGARVKALPGWLGVLPGRRQAASACAATDKFTGLLLGHQATVAAGGDLPFMNAQGMNKALQTATLP